MATINTINMAGWGKAEFAQRDLLWHQLGLRRALNSWHMNDTSHHRRAVEEYERRHDNWVERAREAGLSDTRIVLCLTVANLISDCRY